ncbi:beta-N-acetylhexosaminidase [Thalassotalea litorea]|uniref:Beta-hexosaminidase n=1 Tax=Thalassotalea litorea TaxID=2020715 RepID=A0A5R9IPB0_9GAMM|nr:beta-N-acetylhexosaminidase [Thalassotalea litorea]TLU61839.1 beta-N-acetylhexosaminidase [Thalassotalea litorea]
MSCLMVDVEGLELTAQDREILAHPHVGGIILFARNYQDPEQLRRLTTEIKSQNEQILIGVDQEGGRVQRFRSGYTKLPAMGKVIERARLLTNTDAKSLELGCELARNLGYLMAIEVQSAGVDISFAPVLDVDDVSDVIGDRGFDMNPQTVTDLASAFIVGMNEAGMLATGKHFPGHGSVKEDSHIAMPVDDRQKANIFNHDMTVFQALMSRKQLGAVMPAHVIYPNVDHQPVGFSKIWLKQILRKDLGFNGVIFSDDLSMKAASVAGGYVERCEAALDAGCDMLLLCNDRPGVEQVLDHANLDAKPDSILRVQTMLSNTRTCQTSELHQNKQWLKTHKLITKHFG